MDPPREDTQGDTASVQPSDAAAPPAAAGLRNPFSALSSAPFRYLWLNTFGFALIQATQRFTYVWLVLVLGGGPSAAGFVAFALGIPVLLLTLIAGVVSDRIDRRQLLVWTQLGATVVTAATAALIWTGTITIGITYVLALLIGATTAFGQPVRQAIVPSIVARERLMNAVALMTIAMNVSLILGPALGGGVIALWGLGGAFAVQTAFYGATLLALVPLRLPPHAAHGEKKLWSDFAEGIAFIVRHRGIRTLVLLLLASGVFMIGPFQALLPHLAQVQLGQGALGASLLFTVLGAGMLCTSLILASRRPLRNMGGIFAGNLVVGGIVLAAIGLSHSYVLTIALMFVWGLGGGIFMTLNQTLIQSHTPPELMGRVMGVHTLAFMGASPVGALASGLAADAIGASTWLVICGAVVSAAALTTLLTQPTLRRMSQLRD